VVRMVSTLPEGCDISWTGATSSNAHARIAHDPRGTNRGRRAVASDAPTSVSARSSYGQAPWGPTLGRCGQAP
jgi:hypothetical protein